MGERRGTKGLELWCKKMTEGYPGVKVENMTTSWRDGLAFCAMIHHFRPELIDFSKLNKDDVYRNNELAFRVAEQYLGIPALLEPEDMVEYPVPDRLSILTYLSQFYQAFAVSHGSSPSRVVPKRPATAPDRGIVSPASTSPPTKMAVRSGGVTIGMPRREPCAKCGLPVFIAERLNVGKQLYHRTCFRCARCNSQLTLQNYYETETENQYCCETCPDEEKVTPKEPVEATNQSVITRSLSDEEKSAGLKAADRDDYSCMFETALDYTDFKTSDDTTEFTKARSHFINALLESSDEEDPPPPDLPKSKPPPMRVSDAVNPTVNTNIQSSGDSEPLKTRTVGPSVNNNRSVSVSSNQQKTAGLELDIVTKENVQQNTSLVQARMRLFQGNTVPLKHSKSKRSDVISVNLDSRRIREDVVEVHSLPSKENNTEVIVLDSSDSVIVISDDSIMDDNKKCNQEKDSIVDDAIITITDDSLPVKDEELEKDVVFSLQETSPDVSLPVKDVDDEKQEKDVKHPQETPPDIAMSDIKFTQEILKGVADVENEIKFINETPLDDVTDLSRSAVIPKEIEEQHKTNTELEIRMNDDVTNLSRSEALMEREVNINTDKEQHKSNTKLKIKSKADEERSEIDIEIEIKTSTRELQSETDVEMETEASTRETNIEKEIEEVSLKTETEKEIEVGLETESKKEIEEVRLKTETKTEIEEVRLKTKTKKEIEEIRLKTETKKEIEIRSETETEKITKSNNEGINIEKEITSVTEDELVETDTVKEIETHPGEALNIPLEVLYPQDLNPFGDEEPPASYEKSLNPFGDDEEEEEEEQRKINPKSSDYELKGSTGDTPEYLSKFRTARVSINPFDDDPDDEEEDVKPVPLPRKILAPRISLNPFWEDPSRDKSSLGLSGVNTPEPLPRTSGISIGSFGSSTSISSGTSSVNSRKKKAAPRPPIPTFQVSPQHSVNSSPSGSVHHSPRLRKNKRAPLPPTSTPFITRDPVSKIDCSPITDHSTLKLNTVRTNENAPDSLNLSVISPTSSIESGEYEKEKVVKDEANRNRQSLSSYVQSPDKFQIGAPDKSTYGKWKRKKGQAPSRPIPQKRTIKALPIVEVRRELDLIEVQQQGLEKQGVRLEQIIRERCEGPNADPEGTVSIEVEDLILQLFEVVNEKNELCRRQAELMYLQRQHRLEEEHAEVEYQIRCLMLQPEANKTDSDKAREEELINRLVDIVERRNEIIECLEMDRVREAEEDDSICTSMNSYASKRDECSTPESISSPKKKDKKRFKKKFKLRSSQKLDMDKDVDESESANSSIVVKEKEKKKKKFNLF